MSNHLNPETYVRLERPIGVVHGEAFQLMLYRSKDGRHERWFWNSRDGVTPFGTTVDGVEMTHAMRGYPTTYSSALPKRAEFVWVDLTPEAWVRTLHKRWKRFAEMPAGEWHDPAEFIDRFPTPESFEEVEPFEHGQPMQVTRDEFLASTISWMGKREGQSA